YRATVRARSFGSNSAPAGTTPSMLEMTARLVASRWLHRRAEPSARERRRRRRCFAASAWFAASGVFLPPLARGAPGDGLASFDPAAAAWLGPLLPTAVEERSE